MYCFAAHIKYSKVYLSIFNFEGFYSERTIAGVRMYINECFHLLCLGLFLVKTYSPTQTTRRAVHSAGGNHCAKIRDGLGRETI